MRRVVLNRNKLKLWDIKKYHEKYGLADKYKLTEDAPRLFNIDGAYVEIGTMLRAVVNKKDYCLVYSWVNKVLAKPPIEPPFIEFILKRK